ncbi:hypothetical protein FEM48_Zijuj01G0099200 [Ziziphus jujuba var. spinosa]|uniref:ATP-dependent DNA helicase n=1 Tax=Ziziphus jujuba var. spinosa TaxID=714518 RepID=A0A978W0K4_ZIZJJ|nr:hypothetical protein FEM48_Zijuj01G0099200 [Ziziphus jujuba var. spinosa]
MMPFLGTVNVSGCKNRLIMDELCYDRIALAKDHNKFISNLIAEQKYVYETIVDAVEGVKPSIFFLYGYGGTGKTFVWKTLSITLRLKRKIMLIVASSGITSLLSLGDRTTHSSLDSDIDKNELKAFSKWISSIRDGTIGTLNDSHAMLDIPDDLLIKDTEDSVASVVNSMYPSFS